MAKKDRKNILVTGATGFIGQNLVPSLAAAGHQVTLLARPGESLVQYPPSVSKVVTELAETVPPAGSVEKMDIVIHLAGSVEIDKSLKEPEKHIQSNLAILLNMLRAVRLAKKKPLFIFPSTDRSYGRTKKKVVDETEPTCAIEPYTASKILGEKIIEAYHYLYDIPYIIFRIDSVYGPFQPRRMFMADIICKMLGGEKITIGGLAIKKNFVHVADVASAFLAAVKSPVATWNDVYNVGGRQHSLKEVLDLIDKAVRRRTGRPNILTIKDTPPKRGQKNEVRPFLLSTKKISTKLKWRPGTELAEGINDMVDHLISQDEKK